jgi:hypothetical protein
MGNFLVNVGVGRLKETQSSLSDELQVVLPFLPLTEHVEHIEWVGPQTFDPALSLLWVLAVLNVLLEFGD